MIEEQMPHDEFWESVEKWLMRSEWIINAVVRKVQRNPSFDPEYVLDVWTADRELLIEAMRNTRARSLRALWVKSRALREPCDYPNSGLRKSVLRDLLTMVRVGTPAAS